MSRPVPQVLQNLQGGPPERLYEAYGSMYKLLAKRGHPSWQDHLLSEVGCCLRLDPLRALSRPPPT